MRATPSSADAPPSCGDVVTAAAPAHARMPRQVAFIIGNEGCERFSFYGMRNILTQFLVSSSLLFTAHEVVSQAEREAAAKEVFHTFVIGVYLFPILGGFIADRLLGKYRTVLWLSLVYCLGHACLAAFEGDKRGFFVGLFLIALGSGGIKPCVASFVGDQFHAGNKHLAKVVFDAFYWIINFGSFFASLSMPVLLRAFGPSVAFGVPGILMATATFVFWLGRKHYVNVPPARAEAHGFVQVARDALRSTRTGRAMALMGQVAGAVPFVFVKDIGVVPAFCSGLVLFLAIVGFGVWTHLERVRGLHPDVAIDGVRAVLRVLVLFFLVTPFHSLFDQKASTWVLQAGLMDKPAWFQASQMQALNPLLVMVLIPFNNLVLFPALQERGLDPTPLRRMALGIALASVAWVIVGAMQRHLDSGGALSITWQVLPYGFLTLGEVLVSATALEVAYSQAPPAMKGVLMSFWNLTTAVGNLWVLLTNAAVKNPALVARIEGAGLGVTAVQMFFFAAFAAAATVCFVLYARRYPMVDHYRKTRDVV